MEQIFELLKLRPIISIVLGFILSGFLAWLFRDVIEDYLRKNMSYMTQMKLRKQLMT